VRTGQFDFGRRFDDQRSRATTPRSASSSTVSSSRSSLRSFQNVFDHEHVFVRIDPKSTAQSQRTGRNHVRRILPEPERRRREAATRGAHSCRYHSAEGRAKPRNRRAGREIQAASAPLIAPRTWDTAAPGRTDVGRAGAVPETDQNVLTDRSDVFSIPYNGFRPHRGAKTIGLPYDVKK